MSVGKKMVSVGTVEVSYSYFIIMKYFTTPFPSVLSLNVIETRGKQ